MTKIIEINNLSFGYQEDIILEDIDLEIAEEDFVALIGPNGSGKSTLLKLIINELQPITGEIKLFGQPITDFSAWDQIGYISQEVRSFNSSFPATVKEVVGASLYQEMGFVKLLTAKLENKIAETLELVDMLDHKDKQLGKLSGGQQQRAFIARTLITNPEVILLDEPLVGVDAKVQEDFYQLMGYLNQKLGITILMISHDIHIVSNQANKVVCFGDGQVFTHQTTDFDYNTYLEELKGTSRMLVPEHDHQVVKNK
ncbi:metal ABC transporter ATP-binding protein [Halanaerobaculum tunisiense]